MAATTLIGTLCIRADANDAMGTGHVMRCLALAQAWGERGGRVVLLSRALSGALAERAAAEGLTVRSLEGDGGSLADAEATLAAARQVGAQWLVLDGYHFSPAYRRALEAGGVSLLVVDDLADTDLGAADLVLNQNVYAQAAMYPGRSGLLLGCEHALLRREFRATARAAVAPVARRVLVTLGGSDPDNATERVADALSTLRDDGRLHVQLIVGAVNRHRERLEELLPNWQEVHDTEILVNPRALPELMRTADVAISAAGGTCWELAALGVPTLLVVIADNQRLNAETLAARGAAIALGDARHALSDGAAAQIRSLLGSAAARQRLSETGRRLVDGRGALRVVEALAAHPLQLRRATSDDSRTIWEWVNDPATRRASFQSGPIAWEEHQAWFARRVESDDACAFYMASDASGRAVGTARFQREGREAEISLNLAPQARGRGFGTKLIRKASFQVLDSGFCSEVLAWVQADNAPSLAAFRRAGFRDCGPSPHLGVDAFQFRWDGGA
jgi:UDP-2,4-diacetamido-2,4,6-trideoxy-beta-L-altropyranose hydrolase